MLNLHQLPVSCLIQSKRGAGLYDLLVSNSNISTTQTQKRWKTKKLSFYNNTLLILNNPLICKITNINIYCNSGIHVFALLAQINTWCYNCISTTCTCTSKPLYNIALTFGTQSLIKKKIPVKILSSICVSLIVGDLMLEISYDIRIKGLCLNFNLSSWSLQTGIHSRTLFGWRINLIRQKGVKIRRNFTQRFTLIFIYWRR